MKIPSVKIYFPEDKKKLILERFKEILNNGQFTLGKYGQEFESKWQSYLGVKHAIAVNSGTSAIEIPVRALKLENSEIIVPTNTFIATASAIVHAKAKPVLADIKENLCLDPESVKAKITNKTKAVIFVHIAGNVPKEILEIKEICKDHNLFLIEDAAHAQGSSLNGQKAGTFGDVAAFSFYPTKVITSGEGGLIVTNSNLINEKSRIFRDQGKESFLSADFVEFGHNYRLSEFHAAIGLAHFDLLEQFIDERNKIAEKYDEGLKKINKIRTLKIPECRSNYYKYVAFLDNVDRKKLKELLKEKYSIGLSGEVYETPLHLQKAFSNFGYKLGDFPNAEKFCSSHICLPIYNSMQDDEINYVLESLNSTINEL